MSGHACIARGVTSPLTHLTRSVQHPMMLQYRLTAAARQTGVNRDEKASPVCRSTRGRGLGGALAAPDHPSEPNRRGRVRSLVASKPLLSSGESGELIIEIDQLLGELPCRSDWNDLGSSHWIVSSAPARMVGGIVRPSAFAVLRFTDNLNLRGGSTGIAAGLAPLRIRSTKPAARRNRSS